VSLLPKQEAYAKDRASKAGINFSRYMRALIEYDRSHNILAHALTLNLRTA